MANEVVIRVTSDDDTRGGFDSAKRKAGGLGDKLGAVGKAGGLALAAGVAVGVTKVVQGIGDSIDAASNLGESMNAVDKVFQSQAGSIKKWGEQNAASFGLSTRAFNELATPLGAGLKNAGLSLQDTSKWTIDLTKRASDMASVFNTDVSEAMEAIQSGLRGEADPLEKFGVGLSAAKVEARALAMTGKDNAKSLSDQEKMFARLDLIMEQTKDTAGDFRSTSDSVANSNRVTAAEVENLQAKIGQKMLPMVQKWNQAKLALVGTLGDKLLPAMDKALPAIQELGQSFLKGLDGFKGAKDALHDVQPELEWLGEQGVEIFKDLVKAAETYGKFVATMVEFWIRAIGKGVDAFLFLKEHVSGALAAGLTALKFFTDGMFNMAEGALRALLKLAEANDAVFNTSTAKGVQSALDSLEDYRRGVDEKLGDAIDDMHELQNEARSDRNVIKLKADKQDIEAKIADVKRRLRDPKLTNPQKAKLRADASRLRADLIQAQAAINRLRGKTVTLRTNREIYTYRFDSTSTRRGRQDGMAHGGIVGAQGGGPRSGLTMVGEHGRELLKLAPGTQVHSNPDTERMLAGRGGGTMHILLEIPGLGTLDIDLLNKTIQTNRGIRASIKRAAA
jgi:hypothetical protein